jgi:hypothetical protein
MKEINKEEMFSNLKGFLKSKGIELQEGSYSHGIRKGCDMLTDTVNLSQRAFEHARDAMDKGLDQVRQTIHEKTAPKPPTATSATADARPKAEPDAKPNGTNASSAKATRASAKKNSAKRGKK